MKQHPSKYHYGKYLPGLMAGLMIPVITPDANAAVVIPDGFGNVLVTTPDSGANSILVPAGQPAGLHTIQFNPNTFLTGDGTHVIELQSTLASGASYQIVGSTGLNISAPAGFDGITTANTVGTAGNLTIYNYNFSSGTINSFSNITGDNGISGGPGTITVINYGTIMGIAGDGISSTGAVNFTNAYGFNATAANVQGSVNGILAGDGSSVTNAGLINGSGGAGVTIGDNAFVTNVTSITSSGVQIGGSIRGQTSGIIAGDNAVITNNAFSSITGINIDGINAGINASVTNAQNATINGVSNGVFVTDGTVTNSGIISSSLGDGIEFFSNASTLNNSGYIFGSVHSVYGSFDDDTFNVFTDGFTTLDLGSGLLVDSYLDGNVDGFTGAGENTLNFGGGVTSSANVANAVTGDVLNFATVNVAGPGVTLLNLPGDGLSTIEGDVFNITSGGLYMNGNVTAADGISASVINAGGAALGGTGTWLADVNITNGGISAGAIPINLDFLPERSVGTLDITGAVDHSAGSFIRFDVIPGTFISNGVNSDLITNTGTYDVGGTNVRISPTSYNTVVQNGTYTLVDSNNPITGFATIGDITVQFNPNVIGSDSGLQGSEVFSFALSPYNNSDTVLANFFSSLSLADGGTNLVLNVMHDFEGLALSPNAAAFGAALDASVTTGNSVTQDFIAALDLSDLDTVQAILGSATPDATFATTSALASGNYRLHRLVSDHLAMARTAGTADAPVVMDAKGGVVSAPAATNNGNVWGTYTHSWKETDGYAGGDLDGEESAFTAGVDWRLGPKFVLGLVIDGSSADYDYTGGDSDVESIRGAVYGTYGAATGLYVDFLAGYGNHDIDINRNLGIFGNFNSDTDADSLQAMLTVGYSMQSGCLHHGPFLGVEYQNIDVDGYRQSGLLPLAVDGYDVDSLRILAGYRLQCNSGKFSPYLSVAYAHETGDDDFSTTATLPSGAGFGVTSAGFDSAVLISAGTGYAISDSLQLNLGYHGEIATGDEGTDSHGATLGLKYSF
ncbi:serine protease [Oceaniferula spumae]|uniref:Serine protease n=1 Tax=Oceaniferula spumae TaxID=2979115 RepID=A0AAT9FRK6_9BACT